MNGSLAAPIMYLANRAARGFNRLTDEAAEELARDYGAVQSKPSVKAPVSNPRANPAYAAQVFSPDYIDRMIKAQVTGQPIILPGVEVTAPKSNTSAGKAQGQSSGTAQSKPSYDTNTL